jgi:hypothetical protein
MNDYPADPTPADLQAWAAQGAPAEAKPSLPDFPLLDLADAWHDAQRHLADVQAQAETLWTASEYTWLDMVMVRQRAINARAALGTLPPGIQDGIAKDEADLVELEARAEAAQP